MILEVSEWKPDLLDNHGDRKAENVIPDADGYRPWPELLTLTSALTARAQGAFAAKDKSNLNYNYAGDQTALYRLVDAVWTNATQVVGTVTASYSTNTLDWWEFAQWGETVITTNGKDTPQEITLGAANFIDLAGSPPVAKHIAIVKDFVWLGNLVDFPQRVRWSAINDSHSWTVNASTQADFQDLVGNGGHVQKIVGGESAIIFQERATWRGAWVGPPAIFDFGNGPIEKDIGTLAPQSVAAYGNLIFYLSEQGFRLFDGQSSTAIGALKIDRFFFSDLDSQYVNRIQTVVDPANKVFICAYPGSGNTNGTPNKLLFYNYQVGRWATANEEVELLYRHIATGYSLDGLDSISTSIDTLSDSFDSSQWAGGAINMAAFNTSHKTALFTGDAKDATVDTVEVEPKEGRRSKILRVRPLVEGATANMTCLTRNKLSDDPAEGVSVAQSDTGDCPIRSNARYHRYRIETSGTFTKIRGAQIIEYADGGTR